MNGSPPPEQSPPCLGQAAAALLSDSIPSIPDHELLKKIGGGSYGEVWLARNVLGEYRAAKVVYRASFEQAKPYEREFKGIQKFEPISRAHEGHVDILHVGRNDGASYFYYVMELADDAAENPKTEIREPKEARSPNLQPEPSRETVPDSDFGIASDFVIGSSDLYTPRTLKSEIKRRGPLPLDECVRIGLALSRALAHLHQHKLVHRDIKPSNIIFVQGVPKLADIGLVTGIDATRSFVGTDGYIAPEGPGTLQADLYSLGKVLYEMSTGKDRQDFPELPVEWRISAKREQLLEFNEVVLKACEGEVDLRYHSAVQLEADLALLQRGKSIRQKRRTEQRFSLAKRLTLLMLPVALLVAAPPLLNRFHRGKAPNPEAVRLYELGRWYQNQLTDESLHKAIEALDRAVEIDPNYVPAYTALFGIYVWGVQGISEEQRLQRIRHIAGRLLNVAPNLADGHVALSWSKYTTKDWRGAEEEMHQALGLNPNHANAHGIYGYYLSLLGRTDEAIAHGKRAQELDPTSRINATVAAFPFITARQYDQAIAQLNRALELDKHFPLAHVWLARCFEAQSNYAAAIHEFETCDLLSGEDSAKVARRYEPLQEAFDGSGERGYWQKLLEFQQADQGVPEEEKWITQRDRWPVPGIYARLGQKEKALDLLEGEFQDSGANDWLGLEPLYEPLRDEPRFRALLKKAGLEK